MPMPTQASTGYRAPTFPLPASQVPKAINPAEADAMAAPMPIFAMSLGSRPRFSCRLHR